MSIPIRKISACSRAGLVTVAGLLLVQASGSAQVTPSSRAASFAFDSLHEALGRAGLVVSNGAGLPEIDVTAGSYWVALRFDPQTSEYRQVFLSPDLGNLARIDAGDVLGDSHQEIVVATVDGFVHIYDRDSKSELESFPTGPSGLQAMLLHDLDGDGKAEILLARNNSLKVYSGDGSLLWSVSGASGYDIAVGQLDLDSNLEIAMGDGQVIDAVTHAVQWTLPSPAFAIECGDIDSDGMDEVIVTAGGSHVRAYDVDTQSEKWTIDVSSPVSLLLTDLNADGNKELLVGRFQYGDLLVYDAGTQTEIGSLENPFYATQGIFAGDLDADGTTEIAFASSENGASGPSRLIVADSGSLQTEWESPDLRGGFVGPMLGDLDGNGTPELVAVCTEYLERGRIVVFDPGVPTPRAISQVVVSHSSTAVNDSKLLDVDGDGDEEILLASDFTGDGIVEIYDYAPPATFTRVWVNPQMVGGEPFRSVAGGDVDSDGSLEILAGSGPATAGVPGPRVYCYDLAKNVEDWRSVPLGGSQDRIVQLLINDTDNDKEREVLALVQGSGIFVLDGATGSVEALLPGNFFSESVLRMGGSNPVRLIAAGDWSGVVSVYKFVPGGYALMSSSSMSGSTVDGITNPYKRKFFLGTGGVLQLHRSLDPVPEWSSQSYGTIMGQRVVSLPDAVPSVYTCTNHAILGF